MPISDNSLPPPGPTRRRKRQDAVAGIREGLAEMKAGLGQPLDQVDAELREKHGIPRDA